MAKAVNDTALPLRWRLLWRAIGWLLVAVIVATSLLPIQQPLAVPASDKWQHFVAYAVLTSWFCFLYRRPRHLRIAVASVALGVLIELLQPLTGYRQAEWLDVLADMGGALIGYAACGTRFAEVLLRLENKLGLHMP